MKHSPQDEMRLISTLLAPELADYPERFVRFAFPWGQKGSRLEHHVGPKVWQDEVLTQIGEHVRQQKLNMELGLQPQTFRLAVVAGRGIGKSALFGMLSHWLQTVAIGSTLGFSANTKDQLTNKTFPEVRKWFSMAINSHWFDLQSTKIGPAKWFAEAISKSPKEKGLGIDPAYYYTEQWLWREEEPSAYAGAHSDIGLGLFMDEASGIPSVIWPVADGMFTDWCAYKIWIAFSNGRENTGGFYDRFHTPALKNVWLTKHINALEVERIDHSAHQAIIDQYGADSDPARVEVYGQFPLQGMSQFIGNALVEEAQRRPIVHDEGAPLIMGVDVARFGDDFNVVRWRKGWNGRVRAPERWQGVDLARTADNVAKLIDETNPNGVAIDHAMGAGVVDMLRRRGYKVSEVHFGSGSSDDQFYLKRTELYGKAKEWLKLGSIDNDPKLFGDLTGPKYSYHGVAKDKILLEPKDMLKARIGRSPDDGDAFVLTFAINPARTDRATSRGAGRARVARDVDYPVFG